MFSWEIAGDLALILFAQILFVTLTTVRWIILIRGRAGLASIISFFEIALWIWTLGRVVTQVDSPLKIGIYAAGYALGQLIGAAVEERLAIGYTVTQIISEDPEPLARLLRDQGLAVTAWQGEGRSGPRGVLMLVNRRRHVDELYATVLAADPDAFLVSFEPRNFHGGFLMQHYPAPHHQVDRRE